MAPTLTSLAVTALAAGALLAPAAAQAQSGNPLFVPKDDKSPGSADPGVLLHNGNYLLTSTGSGLVRTSNDLVAWRNSGQPLFKPGGGPKWARDGDNVAAPQIYFLPAIGQYVLLFNAVHGVKGKHCIGRAISPTPDNFVNDGRESYKEGVPPKDGTLECEGDQGDLSASKFSLIDPSLFKDPRDTTTPGGAYYLLYKRDFDDFRKKDIVVRPIGIDAKSNLGPRTPILTAPDNTSTWVGNSVEAPTMIYRPLTGRYYLFFSGGSFNNNTYAVGVAASMNQDPGQNRPNGTFKPYDGNPILRGAGDKHFCGVGHQDVTNTGGDDWRMFYHAYLGEKEATASCGGGRRYLMSDVLNWNRAGGNPTHPRFWPSVNDGTPSGDGNAAGSLDESATAAPPSPAAPSPTSAPRGVRGRSASVTGGRRLRVALRSSVPGKVAVVVLRVNADGRAGRQVAKGGRRVPTTVGSKSVRTRLTRTLPPGRYVVRLTTYNRAGKRVDATSVRLRLRKTRR